MPHRAFAPFSCLALCLAASAACALARPAQRPRLCIEYFPTLVYADEAISVCTRVETPSDKPEHVRLTAALLDGSGTALAADTADGHPVEGVPWRHLSSLRADGPSPATLRLVLRRPGTATPLATVALRILSAQAPLPQLAASGTRLLDEKGRPVVVRLDHRVRVREQRWPLVRWIRRKVYGDRWAAERVVLIGEDLGDSQDGYLALLGKALRGRKPLVVAAPSETREVSAPALRAVAALSATRIQAAPDLAVLCLGHMDPDFGTDALQFGLALELLIQQLERRGCSQFVLIGPVGPKHLAGRLEPYIQAARRVAHTYRGRFLDPAARLGADSWAVPGAGDHLVLRLPNATGHRALADAIAAYLRGCLR